MHSYPLTVKQLMTGAMDRFATRTALVFDGAEYTYAELSERANRLGNALVSLGVRPGDPVGLLLPNGVDYVVADQAIVRIGAAKVPLNDMSSAKDIAYCLADSRAEVVISEADMLAAACDSGSPHLRLVIACDDAAPSDSPVRVLSLAEAVAGAADTLPTAAASEQDVALIMYTGGTTGRSKGVVHRQFGLAQNLLSHLIETSLQADDRALLMTPLPHSAGFLMQTAFLAGATVLLEQKFDPELALRRISEDGVSFTFMVPTMIYRVLDAAAGRELDLSSLRTVLYGAAPITRDRLEQGLEVLGPVFMQIYGQSEAPNFITRLRREDHSCDPAGSHRLASCGQAVTMARVKIVDPDDPARPELPVGQVGEVAALTPYTMDGYWQLPEVTGKSLQDGWLYTGDLGRLDDEGYLYLLDRKNDLIISGGMNVYSSEVETVIALVEGIERVSVVGIPHADWGEAVVACIVPDSHVDLAELKARVVEACRRDLSRYKVPKSVIAFGELPVTAYGKIDKKALRAGIQQTHESSTEKGTDR